jgi:two-component system phosphate regulon sensor histidine kinase PhoR
MSPPDSLLESLPDATALLDHLGRIRQANAALGDVFQVDVAGRSLLELTRSADAGDRVGRALSGERCSLELALPAVRKTLLLFFAPCGDGALLTVRDITQTKTMEAARRDFVANASHELRTPVTAICGAAETLLGGAMRDPVVARDFVEMISRHAERLSQLTQELLDLSRIESGEWKVHMEMLDAAALARSSVELLRARAREKNIRLEMPSHGELRIRADRRALEQVLVNLLDNAVKYTPTGGQVTLEIEVRRDKAVLWVKDTGPGIERQHLSRLFERFYRADRGRTRDAGGTGLGLAIVKHLVQAQGGEVGVDSDRNGSRFWVEVPRVS